MVKLASRKLTSIDGGAIIYMSFDWIYKIYRTIKIKWLMKKLFVD